MSRNDNKVHFGLKNIHYFPMTEEGEKANE